MYCFISSRNNISARIIVSLYHHDNQLTLYRLNNTINLSNFINFKLKNGTRRESIAECWIWLKNWYQSGKSWRAPKLKLLIFIWEAFGNSRMFPDLKQDREAASPEWQYWVRTRKRMFPNVQDGKNPVPGKWHSGTQTSSLCLVIRF